MKRLLLNDREYSHFEISIWSGVHSPIHMTDGRSTITVRPKPSQKIGNVSIFFDEDKSNFWAEYIFDPENMTTSESKNATIINQAVLSCSR